MCQVRQMYVQIGRSSTTVGPKFKQVRLEIEMAISRGPMDPQA